MECKYKDNWMEQEKCEQFKRNLFGRCKFIKDCPKGRKTSTSSNTKKKSSLDEEIEDALRDYGIRSTGWFDDGYTT